MAWTEGNGERNGEEIDIPPLTHLPFLPEPDSSYWNTAMQGELAEQLAKAPIVKQAKNVIIFIGDGTSITTLTAARLLKGYRTGLFEHQEMAYEKFPYSTLIKVRSGEGGGIVWGGRECFE